MISIISKARRLGSLLRIRSSSYTSETPKLRIIFGSQTGTAEAFANELECDACDNDIEAEVIDAMDFTMEDLSISSNCVTAFIMATQGEGEPTDNAKKLYSLLFDNTINLSSMQYTVFGLGNSQKYPDRYNIVGKSLDKRLEQLGGTRVLYIGLGDASTDNFKQYSEWKVRLLDILKKMAIIQ